MESEEHRNEDDVEGLVEGGRLVDLKYLPWGIVGVLIIVGGLTVAAAGLPWQTKNEAAMEHQLIDQRIQSIIATQQTNAAQLGTLTQQVIELSKQNAALQTRMDDYIQQSQKLKMNQYKRNAYSENYARQLDRQHYEAEIRATDAFWKGRSL